MLTLDSGWATIYLSAAFSLTDKGANVMAKPKANRNEKETVIVDTPLEQVTDSAPAGSADTGSDETEDEKLEIPEKEFTEEDHALLSDSQVAGIKAGNIKPSWDTVTVSKKKSPTGKAGYKHYVRLEAVNTQGLSQLFDGFINAATDESKIAENASKEQREKLLHKGACDYANYGFDLERRADTRAKLLAELEGPEKVVKKAVAAFMALDMEPAQIRMHILNSPKYKGVDGLAKIVDSALKG